ncbi:apolipoprotein C-I-like [Tachyglossus aculeatus]|uniref:apolipoprotein C-I-like n=1 Tax=Tachyglossus aculeatus TaxID=9261 RepID=UPI0018F3E824|nr:apolipoprotein C-I-like [Tachyglossus aculeatus]
MKPILSLAVLVVALSVLSGPDPVVADQTESDVLSGFERFQAKVKDLADTLGEKTKAAFSELHDSDFSVKTRKWFADNFRKLKEKVEALKQGQD